MEKEQQLEQFNTALLEAILTEENRKFLNGLKNGYSWNELNHTMQNIRKIREVLNRRGDSERPDQTHRGKGRSFPFGP